MAAAAGSKCFALSYDPKVEVLATDLGLPCWTLPHLPAAAEEITQAWLELYTQGQPLSPQRLEHMAQTSQTHKEVLTILTKASPAKAKP
jgi:polysaccharide pyruvyl transferase WcaK-like protein